MRDCANVEVRDLLPELLHERLVEAERVRVAAHVATCVDCAAELSLLRATAAVANTDTPRVDPGMIAAQVLTRLHEARTARAATPVEAPPRVLPLRPRAPLWRRASMRAAAAAVVLLGGTGVVLRARHDGGAPALAVTPIAPSRPAAVAGTPGPSRGEVVTAAPETVAQAATRAASRAPESVLGASFGDLSDEELAAVVEAVEATDRGPAADPVPAPTVVTSGDVL